MRNEPQPGFRITQITAFTTIGSDDEEGVIAMQMGDTFMPLISADITRLTEMREWAKAFTDSGMEVTERTFDDSSLTDALAEVLDNLFDAQGRHILEEDTPVAEVVAVLARYREARK